MTLRLCVVLAVLLAMTVSATAQVDAIAAPRATTNPLGANPRAPLPKMPTAHLRVPEGATGWIHVKFRDDVKARVADGALRSDSKADLSEVERIVRKYGARMRPMFRIDEQVLVDLEERAAMLSGNAQPDLRGFVAIQPRREDLLKLAQDLNNCACTEHVDIDAKVEPAFFGGGELEACCFPPNGYTCVDLDPGECLEICGIPQGPLSTCMGLGLPGCPVTGQCCFNDGGTCLDLTNLDCINAGGLYRGDETACCQDNACDPGCGDPATTDCLEVSPSFEPFCNDETCCELICGFDPFCCDDEGPGYWDAFCVGYANTFCDLDEADPCVNAFSGSCFEAHPTPGCLPSGCCAIVCEIDPFCCDVTWNEQCVAAAVDLCLGGTEPDPNDTPDFRPQQGHLRPESYENQPGGVPDDLAFPAPDFFGYGGQGWDVGDPSPDDDSNDDGFKDNDADDGDFFGLYGLGRELYYEFGIGTGPPNGNFGGGGNTLGGGGAGAGGAGGGDDDLSYKQLGANAIGKGVNIAVIEAAFYADHEDLDVTQEPNTTLIMIPSITFPDHATACLGLINALDNDTGVVGVAPQADGYFFPLVTVEEGSRWPEAFISCYNTLEPGDVVSCSFRSLNTTNLNVNPQFWALINFGTDLGITTVIAAANDCLNLDDFADLGDSGAIVVGAGCPGLPYYRLIFSNYFTETYNPARGNVIHCQAWGTSVTTTGYGDLYGPGGDPNRFYTSSFGGTSAAAPEIAGLVACLQGLAKQFYGIPLTPRQIRDFVDDGIAQNLILPPSELPGFDNDSIGCALDRDFDEGPHRIGPYPVASGSGSNLILDPFNILFDDAPFLDDLYIARGIREFGNVFSIKGIDGQLLVVESQLTDRHFSPSGFPNPVNSVSYLMTGQIVDLVVKGRSDRANPASMTITTLFEVPEVTALMVIEAYNYETDDWEFVDFQVAAGASSSLVTNPQAFLSRGLEANARITLYGFGNLAGTGIGIPGQSNPFHFRPDFISIDFGSGFGPGVGEGAGGGGGAGVGG